MLPSVSENPWKEIMTESISSGTSFVTPAVLQALINRIDESKALALYFINVGNATETFNAFSLDFFNQDPSVQGARLARFTGGSRGEVQWPIFGPTVPLVITSPKHQARVISTATETLTWTIIYDWVQHPFPAQIKALLLNELRGEIRQINVQRTAGEQYFQVPLIKQIGGGQD